MPFFFYDWTFILIIPVFILALWAQSKVRGNYERYSRVPNGLNLTGAQMARRILDRHGLHDVSVQPVAGMLTDHYDPRSHEVHLSEGVFNGRSVSAVSIAAHECGHALQHATNYVPLQIRASILPVANLGSSAAFPLFFIGLIFAHSGLGILMDVGIVLFAGALLFHLVTLPVELNASARALRELREGFVMGDGELVASRKVLGAAALTYIAATLMALVQLIRMLVLRGERR